MRQSIGRRLVLGFLPVIIVGQSVVAAYDQAASAAKETALATRALKEVAQGLQTSTDRFVL